MQITYDPKAITAAAEREVAPYDRNRIEQTALAPTTREECETAAGILAEVKAKARELDNRRKEITGPLDEAKKKIMDLFRPSLDALAATERALKEGIAAFHLEMERKRQEEEEAQRKLQKAEEDRLRKLAEKAEARGDTTKADAYANQANQVAEFVPTAITQNATGIRGMSIRKTWTYRITDEAKIPREYLQPNEKMLREFATATKGKVKIPGVEIYEETGIASRAGR